MAMIDLQTLINQPLEWRQPNIYQRVFELRVGDTLLATLAKQRGILSSDYDVRMPGGQWSIRQKGFWRTEFVVLDVQVGEIARVRYRGLSGTANLKAISGYEYRWGSANLWESQFAWYTPEGTPLVTFQGSFVTILPAAQNLPDLTLLVVLARYLITYRDDETASEARIMS